MPPYLPVQHKLQDPNASDGDEELGVERHEREVEGDILAKVVADFLKLKKCYFIPLRVSFIQCPLEGRPKMK